MTLLFVSAGLTAGLLWISLPFGTPYYVDGSPSPFGVITNVMLLSHVIIGDLFYWSRVPQLSAPGRRRVVWLTAVGLLLFSGMRELEVYRIPLFYLYFFMHFWKDVDLGFSRPMGEVARGWRHPKWWSGALVVTAYAVLSSGLVTDPSVIHLAIPIAQGLAAALALLTLRSVMRGGAEYLDAARLTGVAAALLLVCTWITAQHPFLDMFRNFIAVWHFVYWYVFYGSRVRHRPPQAVVPARGRVDRLKQSPRGMTTFIILVHALVGLCAWIHATDPAAQWLGFVLDYEFAYVVGYWTVLHITWNWPAKEVKGVRVGY